LLSVSAKSVVKSQLPLPKLVITGLFPVIQPSSASIPLVTGGMDGRNKSGHDD